MNDPSPSSTFPRAFVAAPDPNRYFPAAVMEEARQRISRSIDRGEGPSLVVGAPGTGKTLLLEVLGQQFRDERVVVSLPGAQLCSRRALLQMILFQLELPFLGLNEGELRVSLLCYLRPHDGPSRHLLLLVDEAESLPARLLEELRVLTNVADRGVMLVSLVLAGSASLEERFAEPKMEVLSQRVSTRCYLSALGREETFQYIRAQIAAMGDEPDQLFAEDGLEAMFAATDGVPRLLNQLGSQLLWMAQETGYSPLDGKIVQQAWSELQQLPAPWNTTPASTNESVVEFGELSLDGEDPLESVFSDESVGEIDGEIDGEIVDEIVDETDDDRPASIPIHASPRSVPLGAEEQYAETFDATEHLFEQLYELEANGSVTIRQDATTPPLSENPFEESFDSEEVVLDRYLEFENRLLATAQRVINRADTDFAQQLGHYEVIETPIVVGSGEEHAIASYGLPYQESEPATLQLEEPAIPVEEPVTQVLDSANISVSSEPSELLVVEDQNSKPDMVVVPGEKFRHLFSSLEGASC